MVILDSKVFQLWIICANTQNLNRDVDFFAYAQKFQITICIIPYRYVEVGRSKSIFWNICVRTHNTSMSLGTCSYTQIIKRWKAIIILGISAYVRRIHPCLWVLAHMRK